MRKPDSQLVFDIDLAKQQSTDNPVYYVQYAHARICRILESAGESGIDPAAGLSALNLLVASEELDIIKRLTFFPETVEAAAANFEPHRITNYLHELASLLHSFYNRHRVLGEDPNLTAARLYLLGAVRLTINNGLAILGVSAPEKM
jgi:arginyl-tRNA synthetase